MGRDDGDETTRGTSLRGWRVREDPGMSPADLVRRLVDEQLERHPRTRDAYLNDAQFHAAVEMGLITLTAAAEEVADLPGAGEYQVEAVVRGALNRLLTDRLIAEYEARSQTMALAIALVRGEQLP